MRSLTALLALSLAARGTRASSARAVTVLAPPPSTATPEARFDAFTARYFNERFVHFPSEATSSGVHAYDRRLDDLSPAGLASTVAFLRRAHDELTTLLPSLPATAIPRAGAVVTSDRPQLDATLLLASITFDLHRLTDWDELALHPSAYHSLAADAVYQLMAREFAPLAVRVRAATARMRAIPALLAAGEARLSHPSPLAVDVSLREIEGSIEMIRDVVPQFAHDAPASDREPCLAAAREATRALERHRTFLRETLRARASGDYHAGRAQWIERATLSDGVTESPEQIRDAARAEVERLQGEIRTLGARLARPGESPANVLTRIRGEHPAAGALLETYRARQEAVRAFVREHHIATIDPARDDLAIEPTPGFMRATVFAALSAPGALETVARRTLFYVTPADTTRPASEVDAYLEEHSNPAIVVTTVHEAYPGHHVQLIHQRNSPSFVRRMLWQGSYGEGWAHYCEQMMVDEGFGDDVVRLDQRQEALLRAARAYLDVGVHVFGMSYEDAVRYYRDEAYLSQPGAEMEARRVSLGPASVFVYTYGKFGFYRLRHAVMAQDAGMTLEHFHDALLDFGSAPLPVLARELFRTTLGPWQQGEVPATVRAAVPSSAPAVAPSPSLSPSPTTIPIPATHAHASGT